MGPGQNAVAALALLAGLGATVAVPAVLSVVLPGESPVPSTARLDVGYGVSLVPPPGARLRLDDSRPGAGNVAFRVGTATVTVYAVPVPERPAAFVAHTRHRFSRDEGLRSGPAVPVRLAGGVLAERRDLAADPESFGEPGCYAVAVAEQVGVVAVVSPVAGCAAVPADLWAAVTSITVDPQEQP